MTDFKAIASSLEERSFCVVPEFLSREEIDFLEVEDVMETPEVGPGDLVLTSLNALHATQVTADRRIAVSLRTCDPETPIDWHRVAGSPTPFMMEQLARQNPLSFPVFQRTQENHFGITLGEIVPTLTGERE